jgi:hypothetical protein
VNADTQFPTTAESLTHVPPLTVHFPTSAESLIQSGAKIPALQ